MAQSPAGDVSKAVSREPEYPVLPEIISRWSRRAMSSEPIERSELMSLFEAARWAPSSYNGQPWRYIYAFHGSPAWKRMFDLLTPLNQSWCVNAGVLVLLVARSRYELTEDPDRSFALNAGASWQNFALQGTSMGLAVRGMQDFDYDRAREIFNIPPLYVVQMMIAVGRPGDPADLPENMRGRERPTRRKPIADIAFENEFREPPKWDGY